MSTLKVNTVSDLNNNSFPIENADTRMAKAWVNFSSSSGTPTIGASYNVSSITDIGVGHYGINFTFDIVDANYAVAGYVHHNAIGNGTEVYAVMGHGAYAPTVSGLGVYTKTSINGALDMDLASLVVYR